jgi:hypothetical protein
MIRCEMAGCVDMAGFVVKYKEITREIVEYDLCQSCAEYLSKEPELIRVTPYANKGLLQKN